MISKLSCPACAMASETKPFTIGCIRFRLIRSQDMGPAMTELKPKYKRDCEIKICELMTSRIIPTN